MGSETMHKIPVIKLSENMKPGSDSWVSAAKQVQHGLEEYGCFEMVYEKCPLQLRNSIYDALKDLFDLPKETKMRKTSDRVGAIGYIDEPPAAPLCEAIGIDCPNTLQGAQLFTNTMWPQGNHTFLESLHSFSKMMAEEVYETAIKLMVESYGVERLFESLKESSFHVFRVQRYRSRTAEEKSSCDGDVGIGFSPHEDINFISILHEIGASGLEIKTKDDQWIDWKPSSSASFIIMAGNVLAAWSNDRVRPCMHRVVAEDKVRYSIGTFIFTKGLIHVPQEFVDEQHPLLYNPIDCFGYRVFVLSQRQKFATSSTSIRAFCGI